MVKQLSFFPNVLTRQCTLPVIGEQKDIRYHATRAREILNGPGTTGFNGFWSINPYVGCAFGCAYCHARYAQRYALERALVAHPANHADLRVVIITKSPLVTRDADLLARRIRRVRALPAAPSTPGRKSAPRARALRRPAPMHNRRCGCPTSSPRSRRLLRA